MIDGGTHENSNRFPKVSGRNTREVRESLSIRPGEKMQVIDYADRIDLVFNEKNQGHAWFPERN